MKQHKLAIDTDVNSVCQPQTIHSNHPYAYVLGCDYEGSVYDIGATFPSVEWCNECNCTTDGVQCTEDVCRK